MKEFIALAVAVAFYVGCDLYDVILTEKGIRAGVAVEGNTFLVGSKPSAVALYLRDILVAGIATVPCVLALSFHNLPIFWGCLVAPVVAGVKHILGGLAWAKLLKK
jgi:hypothetical protein